MPIPTDANCMHSIRENDKGDGTQLRRIRTLAGRTSARLMKTLAAVAFGMVFNGVAHSQEISTSAYFLEAFSNADGTVQFVMLELYACCDAGVPVAGQTLVASDGLTEHQFTFPTGATSYQWDCEGMFGGGCTYKAPILVATQGFADLNLVKPDFVVPNGFLFLPGGSVRVSADEAHYAALPTDGKHAYWWGAGIFPATASNSAAESYSFTPNYQGLWWAAGGVEPGWGINLAHSADVVFATWYTYDTSGNAWWVSMLAPRTTPTSNTYAGRIYVDTGPRFDKFAGAATPSEVGSGTLTFSDANNGVLDYSLDAGTGGSPVPVSRTKAIERFNLGTGPQLTCTFYPTAWLGSAINYQDLWWGTQPGWGINLAHQGDTVFATWYTYDDAGAPLWLSALTQRVGTTNAYAGTLMRTSGPPFDAYSGVVAGFPVGAATLTFISGNLATFAYTISGLGLPVISLNRAIARFPFGPGGTVCQ